MAISLSSATKTNLLALQTTSSETATTQQRLSTGLKVNSAIDDALAFFKARDLNNRASDLATIKDNITQAVSTVTEASNGLTSIESTLQQMKAIAQAAQASSDTLVRSQYASQFNSLRTQIDNFANDASYNGVNLLKATPDNMTVVFNEKSTGANSLQILGADMTATGLQVLTAGTVASAGWLQSDISAGSSTIDTAISSIDSALTTVRTQASTFGTNASMLQIRATFTTSLINTLTSGAGNLVNADVNEESANMLALQTRQQLGIISLQIAQQSEQAVLRLF